MWLFGLGSFFDSNLRLVFDRVSVSFDT
jgi:hypothetical protein